MTQQHRQCKQFGDTGDSIVYPIEIDGSDLKSPLFVNDCTASNKRLHNQSITAIGSRSLKCQRLDPDQLNASKAESDDSKHGDCLLLELDSDYYDKWAERSAKRAALSNQQIKVIKSVKELENEIAECENQVKDIHGEILLRKNCKREKLRKDRELNDKIELLEEQDKDAQRLHDAALKRLF